MNAFSKKRVLFAFPNASVPSSLSEALSELGMETAGAASGVLETHNFLLHSECDFVFASIFLPMLPSCGLEEGVYSLPLYKRPAILYFAPEHAGEMMLKAYSPLLTLPASAREIEKKLNEIYPVRARSQDIKKAEEILSRMGFEDVLERSYLAHACALSVNDLTKVRSLKGHIYPSVSRAFGVGETKIADSMRRLIDKTFLLGDIESQYRLFGSSIDETRGKPTVSQLLALVAEMIRTGKAE
ncbi:MAG: hypothetical protein IKJ65_10250 [Clostridia bacterium]|nr:hypothetical protein [Clostridia bacterium]